MPEGPEVETEGLREAIHEEVEHEGGAFLKRIALTTALFATDPSCNNSELPVVNSAVTFVSRSMEVSRTNSPEA